MAKWTCPHCSQKRFSVMPWVAARWEVTGCGPSCMGPMSSQSSAADDEGGATEKAEKTEEADAQVV